MYKKNDDKGGLRAFLRPSPTLAEVSRTTKKLQDSFRSDPGAMHHTAAQSLQPLPFKMHELSIAMSLIEVAAEEAERLEVRVDALHLRLGPLSGVVKEALLFSFDLAAEGTAVAGARLEIEEVPVVVFCPACQEEKTLPSLQSFHCPVCDTPTPDVVRGRELELATMEVSAREEEKIATPDR